MEPTNVTCSSACTVTLVVSPMQATQEQYDAANIVFGAVLAAACAIWGAKKLYKLFSRPSTDA